MSKMYVGSIDLNKLDKTKIVTKDKDGKPFSNGAKYYNVVVWVNDTPDQYGNDASMQTSVTKEERESGVKGGYIGNLKAPQSQQQAPLNLTPSQNTSNIAPSDKHDDLPF